MQFKIMINSMTGMGLIEDDHDPAKGAEAAHHRCNLGLTSKLIKTNESYEPYTGGEPQCHIFTS